MLRLLAPVRALGLPLAALWFALPAGAQEWELETSLTLAASALEEDGAIASGADAVLGSAALLLTRSDTLDNGVTLSWRGEVRLEGDLDARPAFAGVLGACPPANPACPRATAGASAYSPVSPATGLAAGGPFADTDAFASLESASLTVSGPWGEGVFGLDAGAAARLDARAPNLLERVSAFTSGLDPTGLVAVRARNDVTGSSLKATYLSPRWLGVRLGASFTPKADHRSADFDPNFGGAGLGKAELEDVFETGLSFARRFRQSGLYVRSALTYTAASSGSPLEGFGDYEAWGAGLELEHSGWTGGVRWLSSNNAWASGRGDYEAVEAGLVRRISAWRIGLEGGWAQDRLTGLESASWLAGVRRSFGDRLDLGLAWMSADADLPALIGLSAGHTNARNEGLVVELTVRN